MCSAIRQPLLKKIESGEIDPSFIITHRLPLDDAPEAYQKFRDKEDGCIKVVLKPQEFSTAADVDEAFRTEPA